jgi:8-oxo-dGTP pyrophosphatase MutT (NUDIX family)
MQKTEKQNIQIIPLKGIEALYEPVSWDFAEARQSEIGAHWKKLVAEKPSMFNGKVLLQHRFSIENGVYHAAYSPVDYASFTAWINLGQPGSRRRNGFAMGALKSIDGAFLLGVMGQHTFNAGKIYFPAGTPDMSDVMASGRVDLAGSVTRELGEETGLRPEEIDVSENWTLVLESYRCAFMKTITVRHDATTARRIILERLATQTDQELADIVIVRSPKDINETMMPEFIKAYLRRAFQAGA